MPEPLALAAGLAAPAFQTGFGIYGAIKGSQVAKQAEQDRLEARQDIADTKYTDYNQAYYEELQRRANVGLPQEQMNAMSQNVDRAAGVGLAVSDDRRGGLIGIGRASSGLANAYTQIGLADVAQRQQNAQMVLGEMANRGQQTYGEVQQLNQYDLATAQQRRQEGISQQQAGFQNIMGGVSAAGTFLGGQQAPIDPYGGSMPQAPQYAMPQAPQSFQYNPPQSLVVNNSPFGVGQGLNSYPR